MLKYICFLPWETLLIIIIACVCVCVCACRYLFPSCLSKDGSIIPFHLFRTSKEGDTETLLLLVLEMEKLWFQLNVETHWQFHLDHRKMCFCLVMRLPQKKRKGIAFIAPMYLPSVWLLASETCCWALLQSYI